MKGVSPVPYKHRQQQHRRPDTQRRKRPFYPPGWDSVPGLPVRRGTALRLGAVPMARKRKIDDHGTGIPVHEVDALARILLPKISLFRERGRTGRTAGVCRVEGTTGTRQGETGLTQSGGIYKRCSRLCPIILL